MRNVLGAAILAACLWPAPAALACDTFEDVQRLVANNAPDWNSVIVVDLQGQAAQDLIAWWNKMPPISSVAADRIVAFEGTNRTTGQVHPNWGFVLFKDGCVVDHGAMPSAIARKQVPQS